MGVPKDTPRIIEDRGLTDLQIADLIAYMIGGLGVLAVVAFLVYAVVRVVRFRMVAHQSEDDSEEKETLHKGWRKANGQFTGRTRKETLHTKTGYVEAEHLLYEIAFYTAEKPYTAWYKFYPLPEPEFIAEGTLVTLQYNEKKPYEIEIIDYPELDLTLDEYK